MKILIFTKRLFVLEEKIRNNLLRYLPKINYFDLEKKFDLDKRPQDFTPEEYLKISENLSLN